MNRRHLLAGLSGATFSAAASRALASAAPAGPPAPDVKSAPKPGWQNGVAAPVVSLTPGGGVKPAKAQATGMRQRRYSGRVDYLDSNRKEIGREFFTVTVQPDGVRTLRALCEMDDFRLLRDVVTTVDADWRPIDSYVRLTMNERFVGGTWFAFDKDMAIAEGRTEAEGRFSQAFKLDEPPLRFGAHPLHGDSWDIIRARQERANGNKPQAGVAYSTSHMANGGSGPMLMPGKPGRVTRSFVGREQTRTAAGVFNTEHVRWVFSPGDQIDIRAMGEDAIPCYQTHVWPDQPTKIFELAELEGDYR